MNTTFINDNKSMKIQKMLYNNLKKKSKNEQKLKKIIPHSLVMKSKNNKNVWKE